MEIKHGCKLPNVHAETQTTQVLCAAASAINGGHLRALYIIIRILRSYLRCWLSLSTFRFLFAQGSDLFTNILFRKEHFLFLPHKMLLLWHKPYTFVSRFPQLNTPSPYDAFCLWSQTMDSFPYVNVTLLSRFSQICSVLRTLLCSLAMNACLLRLLSSLEWLCSPSPACSCRLLLILNVSLIFWNKEAGRGILNIFCWQHSLQVYGPRQKHSPLFFITGTPVSEHNSALSCLFCLLSFHVSVSGLKADGQICTHKSDGAKKKNQ